jgi:hypothetical protein
MLRKLAILTVFLGLSLQGFAWAFDCSMPCCPGKAAQQHSAHSVMTVPSGIEHHHANAQKPNASLAMGHTNCGSTVGRSQDLLVPQQLDVSSFEGTQADELIAMPTPAFSAIARIHFVRDSGIIDPQSPIPIRI